MKLPPSHARLDFSYGFPLGAMLLLPLCAVAARAQGQAVPQMVPQFGSPIGAYGGQFTWSWAARAPVFAANTEPPSGVHVWDTRTWTLVRTLSVGKGVAGQARPGGRVEMPTVSTVGGSALALSPDGRTLAVRLDKTVQVWDVGTDLLRRTLPADAKALLWAPDGRRIVTSRTGETDFWDPVTGQLGARIPAGGASVALSPDGRTLAVAQHAPTVGGFRPTLWTVATGRPGRALLCDPSGIKDGPMAFAPDGRTLAATGEDPHWKPLDHPDTFAQRDAQSEHKLTVKVWDLRTGRLRHVLPSEDPEIICENHDDQLEFSADGRTLADSGGYLGAAPIWAWDTRTWRRRRVFTTEATSGPLAPDGVTVLTEASGLRTTDLRTGARRSFRRPVSPDLVARLAWSPDGARLAAQGWAWPAAQGWAWPADPGATALWVWDTVSGRAVWTAPDDSLAASRFTPDGAALILADGPQVFRIAAATGQIQGSDVVPGLGTDVSVLPAPDGLTVAVNTLGKDTVRIVDIRTGRTRRTLPGFTEHSADAQWSPDGQRLAATFHPQETGTFLVRIRDLRAGRPARTLTVRADSGSLAWTPDGKTLAVLAVQIGDYQRTRVELWDVGTGTLRATLPLGITLTVDDTLLYDNAQIGYGGAVTVSPDGRRLAAVSGRRVAVYDLATGKPFPPVTLPGFGPNALAFSPDGTRLAGGGVDGTHVWRVADGRLLASLISLAAATDTGGADPTSDWLALTPDGHYTASPGAAAAIRWRVGNRLYPASRFAAQFVRPALVRRALLGR